MNNRAEKHGCNHRTWKTRTRGRKKDPKLANASGTWRGSVRANWSRIVGKQIRPPLSRFPWTESTILSVFLQILNSGLQNKHKTTLVRNQFWTGL